MKNKQEILNRLEDVEQVHRTHKRTFSIPRSDERNSLRPGHLVKLVFLADDDSEEGARAERMWVEVQGSMAGEYIGVLTNRPRYLKYVKQGEHVVFRPQHVCAIYVERSDPSWIDPEKMLYVSKDILDDDAWPELIYREEPDDADSSGWRVLSGAAQAKGARDLNALVKVSAHDLMNRFPILDSVLGEPVGTSWSWDEDACEYTSARKCNNESA